MSEENNEGLAVADDVSSEAVPDDSLNDGFDPSTKDDAAFSEPDDGGEPPSPDDEVPSDGQDRISEPVSHLHKPF